MILRLLPLLLFLWPLISHSQKEVSQENLEEVVITSSRIDVPFSKNSRTIDIISAKDIQQSAATTIADVLQQITGVDVRRRGTGGSQADLYLRGGGFDQTLLLIDGIKVEDPQTGHHSLNILVPIEVVERIEVVKGPAARIFGQNAFTGAINIVTKKKLSSNLNLNLQAGSFDQYNRSITFGGKLNKTNHIVHFSQASSDGYRYNTDYKNTNAFVKSTFYSRATPINFIATFSERDFGANGFYGSSSAIDQYEETQASLLGVSTALKSGNWVFKPRVFWKRNQDMYLFVRHNPSLYRNLHISNKIGAEFNASYSSKLGISGVGVDVNKVTISSNNLGDRNRSSTTLFLEHKFLLANNQLDITPGIAVNHFSDFGTHIFPGIDIGYQINDVFRLYANGGITYRVPTYTDLYYSSSTTVGDENLQPESAIAQELGGVLQFSNIRISAAVFNRDSDDLIDYVKEKEEDRWKATNFAKLNSKGIELNTQYAFSLFNLIQKFNVGYTYLEDEIKDVSVNYSRYSINSLKHHLTTNASLKIHQKIPLSIVYKFAERSSGDSYSVVDASIRYQTSRVTFSLIANNIFDESYSETNLVPMPKSNFLLGMNFHFF